jgi:hypothetical protein
MKSGKVLLTVAIAAFTAASANAQVLERPTRAEQAAADRAAGFRRVRLSISTLASFDDNLAVEYGTFDPTAETRSGYSGFMDGGLRFEQGSSSHSLTLAGRGYVNSIQNIDLGPAYGGDVEARFGATIGRRHELTATQSVRSEPFHALGGFAPLRQGVGGSALPDQNPLSGVQRRRSLVTGSAVGLSSQWSPRNAVAMTYRYDLRNFEDRLGDNVAHGAMLSYIRSLRRRSSLKFSYSYFDSRLLDRIGWVPLESHALEAGVNLERRFSATRSVSLALGGGAIHARTIDRLAAVQNIELTAPSATGALRLSWARTWSVTADYRRSVAALDGFSSEAFATNAAVVGLGGLVASRAELTFSIGYADGRASGQRFGAFETYTGTSQLRLTLGSNWSGLVSHSYYRYAIRGVDPIFKDLPAELGRNAVRVGLSLELPVASGRPDRPRRERD